MIDACVVDHGRLDAVDAEAAAYITADRAGVAGDHGEARLHSMKRYPIFVAGSGGGRLKTGLHVAAEGDAATRVGLTLQQVFGVATGSWGTESNRATKPISEILA